VKSRKVIYYVSLLAVLFVVVGAGNLNADSVTDPATNVSYTMTSSFVPEPSSSTFDVTLTVDATHFLGTGGATTGFLSVLSVQFDGGNNGGVDVQVPDGFLASSVPNGCEQSPTAEYLCVANGSPNTVGKVPGVLTFIYSVPESTPSQLPSPSANIFAIYTSAADGAILGSGATNLGETFMSVPIQSTTSSGGGGDDGGGGTGGGGGEGGGGGTPVPEPGVLPLLVVGLIGLATFASRRSITV
jgi:hypothetical protein